jgi:hypothetical protein
LVPRDRKQWEELVLMDWRQVRPQEQGEAQQSRARDEQEAPGRDHGRRKFVRAKRTFLSFTLAGRPSRIERALHKPLRRAQ